jgi:hypothetical protein
LKSFNTRSIFSSLILYLQEANLLRLKEIAGFLNKEEVERWKQIKEIFVKNNKFGMLSESDTTGQMLIQLSSFNDHLEAIARAIKGDR